MKCNNCGHELHRTGLYLDCGGDCRLCMAKMGDDDCARSVIDLAEKYHHQLELVKTNLYRGLSRSLQRLQVRSIEEVLKE